MTAAPAPVPGRADAPPWRELVALALWLLATIALRPLLLPDEGRYAGVALEMLHGDALVPTLDGLPFFHKPPLLYWLDLVAMRLFGVNEFAARLGPALLGWLLGAALLLHLRRWHGPALARCGLAVLATSPLFFLGAQYVNHDIGVAACITVAVLAFVRALDDGQQVALRYLLLAWCFCGLGVLAKGLIGVVLPLWVIVPWLLARRRWRQLAQLLHPAGLLAFAAVVAPWLAAMQWRYPGFLDYFIVEQHFRRYTGGGFNNRMPFWFFFAVLPLTMLPWSLWLARLRPALGEASAAAGRGALYLWWVLAVVFFFSLPASKIVGYVMPAAAPMAALLALALGARARQRWPWLAGAAAVACVAIVAVLAQRAPGSHRELARTLAARMQPGDRVVFVDRYPYDVPFYARLGAPVIVVAGWADPAVGRADDWHRELLEAARFAADGGRGVLWDWSRLAGIVCHPGAVWVLAAPEQRARLAPLADWSAVQSEAGIDLLVAAGRDCAAAAAP